MGLYLKQNATHQKLPNVLISGIPRLPGESSADAQRRIIQSGQNHRTNGFAQTTSFETICEALYTHGYGCVLLPINIYENYTDKGCVGNYPEPRGVEVGSHAQAVVGYDLDEGHLNSDNRGERLEQ